jgi:hypothetical protein
MDDLQGQEISLAGYRGIQAQSFFTTEYVLGAPLTT